MVKINRGVPFFFTLPIIFNGFYPAASLAGGDVSLSNPLNIIAREVPEEPLILSMQAIPLPEGIPASQDLMERNKNLPPHSQVKKQRNPIHVIHKKDISAQRAETSDMEKMSMRNIIASGRKLFERQQLDLKAINLKLEAKETARLALADSLARSQQDKEKLSAQNAELSQALMDLKKQTMDKDKAVETLERNLHDAQFLNEETKQQLALVNQKMAEQQRNMQVNSNHVKEKESARLALAGSLALSQDDKEKLSAQNAELSKALMDLKTQKMEKDNVVETLKRHLSDAQSLNVESEKQLALLNQKMAEQQQRNLQVESNQTQEMETARLALADTLAHSQQDKEQLSVQVAELSKQLLGFKAQISDRDQYIEHLKINLNEALAGKKAAETLNDSLRKDHDDAMQQLAKASPLSSPKPVTQSEMRDYALGVYWAQEIENIIHQKSQDGYDIDPVRVLTGVQDMIHNSVKVPQETIRDILAELYGKNGNDREKENGTVSNTTLNRRIFDGKASVQHSSFGYDYQIKTKGNGKINQNDEVAIVIRESLANGKVINDMIKKGTVISQRLNKLPPLFSTAIALLGNHGELRMVVPPQLAYGEKGHAPEIPPDSTMVYDIIVANVRTVGQR